MAYIKMKKAILVPVLVSAVTVLMSTAAFASDSLSAPLYTNSETNYSVYVEDDANLLTDEEESELVETMQPVTDYGYAVFKTIDDNPDYSTSSYAEDFYYGNLGNESGTMFLIDMDYRKIYICSAGSVYRVITTSKANTITDNAYTYASNGDYSGCAQEVFSEISDVLAGNAIAQPMKVVSNVLLAIMFALLVNFILINRATHLSKASNRRLIQAAEAQFSNTEPEANFLRETKRYSPVQTSSGGGGGGGGFSGGGGGGGGFSGGGGGHSF